MSYLINLFLNYLASSNAICIRFPYPNLTPLYVDNMSAIWIIANLILYEWTKHKSGLSLHLRCICRSYDHTTSCFHRVLNCWYLYKVLNEDMTSILSWEIDTCPFPNINLREGVPYSFERLFGMLLEILFN